MVEGPEHKGARIDAGMNPNVPPTPSTTISEDEKKAREEAARVLNEMEKKHGKTANIEPTQARGMERLEQMEGETLPSKAPQISAGMTALETPEEQYRRRYEEEERETLRPRPTKQPIILRMQAQRQRPFGRIRTALENEAQRLRHPDTKAIKRFGKELAVTPIRTLGNIGESAIVERTKPKITESITVNDKITPPRYEKTIEKTWTERNPFSSTNYTSTSKYYYVPQTKSWVPLEKERITSKTRSPITAEERAKFAQKFGQVLNGAELGGEIESLVEIMRPSGKKKQGYDPDFNLRQLALRGVSTGAGRQFGIAPVYLGGQRRPSSGSSRGGSRKGRSSSTRATSSPITASEMRMATGRGGTRGVKLVQPQPISTGPSPMPALRAQSVSSFANYVPEYSTYGQSYQNQVKRWIGRAPRIVGFLSPDEEPLAWNLVRAQQKLNIGTGVNPWNSDIREPTLSRESLMLQAGLRHSAGPSHDYANQIFNPRYAFYRLRGGLEFRGRSPLQMFMGRPAPLAKLGQIVQVKVGRGKNAPISIVKRGGTT